MSKAKATAEEPSIESLLDSIRRAIHDETDSNAPSAGDAAPAPRATGRQAAASPPSDRRPITSRYQEKLSFGRRRPLSKST